MEEIPLAGGRVTAGVVRIGATVHRPAGPNSAFVRALLAHLGEREFDAAPRYLGRDAQGRETFSFLPGDVPPDLDPTIPDEVLVAAARLIRRFHDATAGAEVAGGCEVVCHNDLSPCNFVFRDGEPVGIIDFDAAAPGERLHDLGYALFHWLSLGADGPALDEQVRRLALFCRAYGTEANRNVIEAILAALADDVERISADPCHPDAEWWRTQLDWLRERKCGLVELLDRAPGVPRR